MKNTNNQNCNWIDFIPGSNIYYITCPLWLCSMTHKNTSLKRQEKKYRDMLSGTYCKDNMEVKKVKDMLLRTFKTYGS